MGLLPWQRGPKSAAKIPIQERGPEHPPGRPALENGDPIHYAWALPHPVGGPLVALGAALRGVF